MTVTTFNWEILPNDDRITLRLYGALSRDTLLPLYDAWQQRSFLSENQIKGKTLIWDLERLEHLDSAGCALLCDLFDESQRITQIHIINPPQQLLTLADLFGLRQWLARFLQS